MDQLEEIRAKIDLVQLISEYLPLKKSGRNFKTLCPFHSEKTPSFMVSPERQIWKCFGCNTGGDIFGFLMKMEGMEFGEALRALAKRAGVALGPYRPSQQEEEKEKLYEINHLASEFYHYLLVSHPVGKKALDYLLGRGIKRESLKLFKLGYAPPLWEGLQKYLVGKKGFGEEELVRAGLVTRQNGQYRDFFRERVLFSLKDHRGNIVGFSGRVIGPWREEEALKIGPKYLNTPETLIYHKGDLLYGLETTKNAIKKKNQAIVVEGELDLISSYQAGVENVVAIKGTALTESQVKLLKRFCENVFLSLDQDIAGDSAARRGIEIADSFGLSLRVVKILEGKDPDELAQKKPETWKKAVGEAMPIYDFFLESAFSRFDAQTPEGKKKIGEEILPIFSRMTDEIVKAYYVKQLARRLETAEEAVAAQMAKQEKGKEAGYKREVEAEEAATKSRREILEEYLLTLAFQGHRESVLLVSPAKKLVKTPSYCRILTILEKFLPKENARFQSEQFAKELPPELLAIFNGFYLHDLGKKVTDSSFRERELEKVLLELGLGEIREKLQKLAEEMAVCEKKKEEKKLEELKEEFKSLSQKLTKLSSKL